VTPAVRRFLAHRGAVAGVVLVLAVAALAILGPVIASHDPIARDMDRGLSELGAPLGPSAEALLGTDPLGRDVWARVLAGATTSLQIAALATLVSLAIGLSLGLVAGYAGGRTDNVLMRFVDLVLAFPYLLLAILLAALLRESTLGASSAPVVLTLGLVGWTTMARVIRGKVLSLARSEYVLAARALGASPLRVVVHHVVPNIAGLVIVVAALGFAQNLLAEAALSYVGLGPPPPAPTWGRMLYEGRAYYRTAPWLTIAPGVAILTAVVAFNLLGEGLRDYLDPKGRR
jgi:ABC-type dipeptide/oligopeptide/nickel transport system permease subunit